MTAFPDSDRLVSKLHRLDIGTRILDVGLSLSVPRGISSLAAPSFRGLLGTLLREHEPGLFQSFFKPGACSHEQPGFAIRLKSLDELHPVFRLVSFSTTASPPEDLSSLLESFLPGMSFGESVIRSVRIAGPFSPAAFVPDSFPELSSASFRFETPLRLKRHGRFLNPDNFSLAFLASAAVERLNALSLQFAGDSDPLDSNPLVAAAALTLLLKKDIVWTKWARHSDALDHDVCMDGCTGVFSYSCLPRSLAILFQWASRVNLGRHTAAGAGAFSVSFSEKKSS